MAKKSHKSDGELMYDRHLVLPFCTSLSSLLPD